MKRVTKIKSKTKGSENQMEIFDLDGVPNVLGHGGKRANAGRKAKEPTIVMRIPESLADEVRAMIEAHKNKND